MPDTKNPPGSPPDGSEVPTVTPDIPKTGLVLADGSVENVQFTTRKTIVPPALMASVSRGKQRKANPGKNIPPANDGRPKAIRAVGKVRRLPADSKSQLHRIVSMMFADGVILLDARSFGYEVDVPPPLTIDQTFEKLKFLNQVDFYTVAGVLLQFMPARRISRRQAMGIVTLLSEGRFASIPNLLRTIAMNPADGGSVIGSSAGQTIDDVLAETEGDIDDLLNGGSDNDR